MNKANIDMTAAKRKTSVERVNKGNEIEGETDVLWNMAIFLRSRHQELPANIWVSAENTSQEPRIRIQKNRDERVQIDDTFSMTISDPPSIVGETGSELSTEDIAYFKDFVQKNKEPLLAYWNGTLDTSDLTDRLMF